MLFGNSSVFIFDFPETMCFSLADMSSWKPVMPRSISCLVMQSMRVANVGGGLSSGGDFSCGLSKIMLFPFKATWSLLAWKQAS